MTCPECQTYREQRDDYFRIMKDIDEELTEANKTLEAIRDLVVRSPFVDVVEEVRRLCRELGEARLSLAAYEADEYARQQTWIG